MTGGGGYTMLATDADGLEVSNVQIHAERDGLNLVGCRNVLVDQTTIKGGLDDAIVLKSDYSLGKPLQSSAIVVKNSQLGSDCNAMNIGSETVGDFEDVLFENIVVT